MDSPFLLFVPIGIMAEAQFGAQILPRHLSYFPYFPSYLWHAAFLQKVSIGRTRFMPRIHLQLLPTLIRINIFSYDRLPFYIFVQYSCFKNQNNNVLICSDCWLLLREYLYFYNWMRLERSHSEISLKMLLLKQLFLEALILLISSRTVWYCQSENVIYRLYLGKAIGLDIAFFSQNQYANFIVFYT
jgi:hypothetical protein